MVLLKEIEELVTLIKPTFFPYNPSLLVEKSLPTLNHPDAVFQTRIDTFSKTLTEATSPETKLNVCFRHVTEIYYNFSLNNSYSLKVAALRTCTELVALLQSAKVCNDSRFLLLWFLRIENEPNKAVRLFEFMQKKRIGKNSAWFWFYYSRCCESRCMDPAHNVAILQKGLELAATPTELLQPELAHFRRVKEKQKDKKSVSSSDLSANKSFEVARADKTEEELLLDKSIELERTSSFAGKRSFLRNSGALFPQQLCVFSDKMSDQTFEVFQQNKESEKKRRKWGFV